MMREIYSRLMAGWGAGDPFDRHLFACAIAISLSENRSRPLTRGLGLSGFSMAALVGRCFPQAPGLLAGISDSEEEEAEASELPLLSLLLAHRSRGLVEEEWMAHILARKASLSGTLWSNLGLSGRADLSGLMRRHFTALADLNHRDLPWTRFLVGQLALPHSAGIAGHAPRGLGAFSG